MTVVSSLMVAHLICLIDGTITDSERLNEGQKLEALERLRDEITTRIVDIRRALSAAGQDWGD